MKRGKKNTNMNDEGKRSATNEVCDTPISQPVTEPETSPIPCDVVHDNVVEETLTIQMFHKVLMYQGSQTLMLQKKKVQ